MADINLTLTLEEVNGVLTALGNMPYAQVSPLVDKVRSQAGPQVQAMQQSQPPTATTAA
jgi:hypothetical protein